MAKGEGGWGRVRASERGKGGGVALRVQGPVAGRTHRRTVDALPNWRGGQVRRLIGPGRRKKKISRGSNESRSVRPLAEGNSSPSRALPSPLSFIIEIRLRDNKPEKYTHTVVIFSARSR